MLYCHCFIKDLATASLPEYVATHSHQTDYLAPLRTRQECPHWTEAMELQANLRARVHYGLGLRLEHWIVCDGNYKKPLCAESG